MTIYDLSFLAHPEFHREENVRHALQGTRETLARADAIIAISRATRQDLIDRLNAPVDRIEDADLRAALRARGYQRAREFSWERCARETLAVYKTVYDRS